MIKSALLIEVAPGKLHIFPHVPMSQDDNMKGFGSIRGLMLKNEVQKDGTKFKFIVNSKLSTIDLIARIHELKPGHPEILPEVKLSKTELEDMLTLDGDRYEYRLYRTNLFNCSYRAFPLLVDTKTNSCYNLQSIFGHLIPEDDLGILIRGEEDFDSISATTLGQPTIIDYLSIKRMCPMCGVVSNMDKPPKKPWHSVAKKSLIDHS